MSSTVGIKIGVRVGHLSISVFVALVSPSSGDCHDMVIVITDAVSSSQECSSSIWVWVALFTHQANTKVNSFVGS